MNHAGQITRISPLFALLLAASTVISSAALAEPCGTVVAAGTSVKLTDNVGPCDGPGSAITVESGGVLDLNGKTVTCRDLDANLQYSSGIVLNGRRDRVSNGIVDGCAPGFVLSGTGHHFVATVQVTNAPVGVGFAIESTSPRNKVSNCLAVDNATHGFGIASDKNVFESTVADGNGGNGYQVEGFGNKFASATATSNSTGFLIENDKTTLTGGSASSNSQSGVNCNAGACSVRGMTLASNFGDGIGVYGSSAKIIENSLSHNGFGVRLHTSGTAKVVNNVSSMSTQFDMFDDVPECANHDWISNRFTTYNANCVL